MTHHSGEELLFASPGVDQRMTPVWSMKSNLFPVCPETSGRPVPHPGIAGVESVINAEVVAMAIGGCMPVD